MQSEGEDSNKKYGPLSEWLTFNISLTLSEKANKRVKE